MHASTLLCITLGTSLVQALASADIGDVFEIKKGTEKGGCDDYMSQLEAWWKDSKTLMDQLSKSAAKADGKLPKDSGKPGSSKPGSAKPGSGEASSGNPKGKGKPSSRIKRHPAGPKGKGPPTDPQPPKDDGGVGSSGTKPKGNDKPSQGVEDPDEFFKTFLKTSNVKDLKAVKDILHTVDRFMEKPGRKGKPWLFCDDTWLKDVQGTDLAQFEKGKALPKGSKKKVEDLDQFKGMKKGGKAPAKNYYESEDLKEYMTDDKDPHVCKGGKSYGVSNIDYFPEGIPKSLTLCPKAIKKISQNYAAPQLSQINGKKIKIGTPIDKLTVEAGTLYHEIYHIALNPDETLKTEYYDLKDILGLDHKTALMNPESFYLLAQALYMTEKFPEWTFADGSARKPEDKPKKTGKGDGPDDPKDKPGDKPGDKPDSPKGKPGDDDDDDDGEDCEE